MKATSIPGHENSFFQTGKDSAGKQFVLTNKTVPNKITGEQMPYVEARLQNGDTSFHYTSQYEKKQILMHFTAGFLKGDIEALTKHNNHVSVPFVIARNGTIINLWSSAAWSYHLGPEAVGESNTPGSQHSVPIEVSNIGYLKKVGNNLVTIYNDDDIYCSLDETRFYTKVDTPYRHEIYYATFTDAQYQSLAILMKYLSAEYNIPLRFLPVDMRYETFTNGNDALNFNGVLSHVNYRPTGKWDFGPAFDWERLIDLLTS